MEKRALVSIVTPCYNAQEFIEETINSVLNQTYPFVEYIIIDDGSKDNSLKIIDSYKNQLKLVAGKHKGACAARNKGAEIAKGEYILFLDADDLLGSNTIEAFINAIEGKSNTLVACNWKRLNFVKDKWVSSKSGLSDFPPKNDFIRGWLSGWYVPPVGILWPKQLFENIGGWDESLAANQDGDLILRALINGVKINMIQNTTVFYRHHSIDKISISSSKSSRHLKSRIKVLEKVTKQLREKNILENYKINIGRCYHNLARNNLKIDIDLARKCEIKAKKYANKDRLTGSKLHVYLTWVFGLETKEKIAELLSNFGFKKAKREKSESLVELSKNE